MGRILVSRVCGLGDLILTLPFLRELGARHPRHPLHFLGHAEHGELLCEAGAVHHSWSVESSRWHLLHAPAGPTPWQDLRPDPREYDEIYLFTADPSGSSLLKKLTGAMGKRARGVPSRPAPGERVHAGRFLLRHLPPGGFSEDPPSLSLKHCPAGFSPESPGGDSATGLIPVMIHPGSGSRMKNWPAERFRDLVAKILAACPGMAPLILEGPSDRLPVEALLGQSADPGRWRVVRPPRLLELACLLTECALFVGNDSGVSHLAAALGIPTVAIFGPSDPLQWAPRGPRARWVGGEGECGPCHLSGPVPCHHAPCLRFPSVEEVWEVVRHWVPTVDRDGPKRI